MNISSLEAFNINETNSLWFQTVDKTVKAGESLLSVAIDGFEIENCVDKISIEISSQKAHLAFLEGNNFYSVLRNKLHWGISEAKD